ncbi:phosphotransferase family protein [Croceicoccus sp. F390]|uniref:Phosphotransferase family protein n=1 Tax=Croceicoccus esteveae TaxID=3075597 RepID=A0ABU2ZIX3_9SPHN|nr:phosphotransferase family protein [Croceicoccus sp. F390]MDT0575973.1 phosphotransferase family protein [Croceicoccus sp. F390]
MSVHPSISGSAQNRDANSGTTKVRSGFELDIPMLEHWLAGNVASFAGPLQVEQFKGGQSNPTYRLMTPARDYVLRRKPPGTLVKGAHAVEREARVMAALGQCGYPVPQIFGLCEDEAVIGTPFFIMELVEGRIFWDATFPGVGREERPAYFDAMNKALADLHRIDHEAAGLGDYGRPGNYFARQIARWSRQYTEDAQAGRNDDMDRLVDWLPQNIPAGDETTVVHGDMRCDNMIFHPSEPRVLAVLDWELSTLGHPLADFAYNAMMYRMPPDIVAGLAGADLASLNIPGEQAYVAAYCQRVGRQNIPDWEFYMAFNFFRLAAIFHGIKGRVLRGTAASAQAQSRAEAFPRLARLAAEAMDICRQA